MTRYLVLIIAVNFSCAVGNATSSCEQKISFSYLDTAVDMISKAKRNMPICSGTRKALDCDDVLHMGYNKSGVYKIYPINRVADDKPLDVYCDMERNGGGWTLIQRRGKFEREPYRDYFFKGWKSYKEGFGDIDKDFWLGNDNIYSVSNQKVYSVRFEMTDAEDNSRYAQYDSFWIDDEYHQYLLHIDNYSGNAGDSMKVHNNKKFSTKDRDNDDNDKEDCANAYKGAWWYHLCHQANPNGLYLLGKHPESFADGINWSTWKGFHESMKSMEIKIRPKKFRPPSVTLKNGMSVQENSCNEKTPM